MSNLLVFVPLGVVAGERQWNSVSVFTLNFLAIIPLASILSFATEELSQCLGETLGGLVNATFGSAVELIVRLFSPPFCTRYHFTKGVFPQGDHRGTPSKPDRDCAGVSPRFHAFQHALGARHVLLSRWHLQHARRQHRNRQGAELFAGNNADNLFAYGPCVFFGSHTHNSLRCHRRHSRRHQQYPGPLSRNIRHSPSSILSIPLLCLAHT